MGTYSLPKPIRDYIYGSDRDDQDSRMVSAIFYSQDFADETINRQRAAKILAGQVEQAARYDGMLAEALHSHREGSYLTGFQNIVNSFIERSKEHVLEEFVDKGEEESVSDLQDRLFFEIWAYRVEGVREAITKFLGVLTLEELRLIEEYLRKKGLKNQKRLNRLRAIISKMEEAGCEENTTVQEFVRSYA